MKQQREAAHATKGNAEDRFKSLARHFTYEAGTHNNTSYGVDSQGSEHE
jgi:hypothetical protein